ncbi:TIGR02444 family protein [Pseudoalteromonas luteoviolacea]|uniref:TIGR02444 family protein n=1 Tax=Pseudoalteromonas luteoviolacea S4054 TaxID=1129367 RepID=A0A0F6A8E1_9GAMM|nr:TIGR02444 family protein [Pseudoalteromonas luteoviolacea]AOT06504.1 hypothetical protein S4054249_00755 [Pseudoalteromonas luteoviolacea]AOT11421.1 hypothetical protein S40542_00755 [Pseudoalteromonas luteoviolacea]AOT16334.1 hypothetical protein S4054_00755 [Pseudoalteromonas luteoviolacea]KKE81674.1 hypothetical protein N479_21415 [Pseudoalteromonas luteoviolacea S4054]KZN71173.1 hypothetical protein N481_19370 [Pseudoalteromonas luteoviolacea S4047-1]
MLSREHFWQYACDVYRSEQVQQVLLECQDLHGKNVNLCLFLDYLSTLSIQLNTQQLQSLMRCVEHADKTILQPYRATRQQVKSQHHTYPDYPSLRKSLLATELELEKLQQYLLIETANHLCLKHDMQSANNLTLYLPKPLADRFAYAKT